MFSDENIGLFGVRMRGNEDLLGFCGFVRLEGMEEMELGYELTQKVWGRGLATEASRACLRYAFEKAGLERVIAGADTLNGASLRVIEKLGMRPVGNSSEDKAAARPFNDHRNRIALRFTTILPLPGSHRRVSIGAAAP